MWMAARRCTEVTELTFLCLFLLLALAPVVAEASATALYLQPLPEARGQYWQDVTGEYYPWEFRDQFSYADARVRVRYEARPDGRLTGTLSAVGLKPHFCYQLKLIGLPSSLWGEQGDDAANERLGRLGRWWRARPEPAWNEFDDEYERLRDDPEYAFEGYLLFDYFVTDAQGAARLSFTTDSSYHVIWKDTQRPPKRYDGPVREFTVGGQTVRLYPEWETGRAWPGTLRLPVGRYQIQWNLTEESFHDGWQGWARVMGAPDTFAIPEATWPRRRSWLDKPLAALAILARTWQQHWPWRQRA